jgi:hypothetical protein
METFVTMKRSNKPDAVNPAIASRLAIVHHWPGVGEPERWPLERVARNDSHVAQEGMVVPRVERDDACWRAHGFLRWTAIRVRVCAARWQGRRQDEELGLVYSKVRVPDGRLTSSS